jgi:hypothetical protein
VPVNAIEFSLGGDAPGSVGAIYFTLAGTSVGRGWDSVGHAPGVYRNRIRVEDLGPSSATASMSTSDSERASRP